ncbi:MAG: polymorphic toxin type 23 domain-containing protein [Bacteroidota bacterium]
MQRWENNYRHISLPGLCLWLSLWASQICQAQQAQIGLVASMGTHEQKLGVQIHYQQLWGQFQAEIRSQLCYQIRHLGSQGHGWEWQNALGLSFVWGESEQEISPYQFLLSNRSGRKWSIGYAYLHYWDQVATSQFSGMLGIGVSSWHLRMENDFLAWQSFDRYRSGAMSLEYWRGESLMSLRSLIWTGDPYDKNNPIIRDPNFPARAGYLDLFGVPYGNCSVGTMSLRILRTLPLGQTSFIDLGIDAEQIRNLLQNRLVHDNPLLPINWGDFKNPHVPMLDENHESYLYREGQSIRRARLFFQAGLNQAALY